MRVFAAVVLSDDNQKRLHAEVMRLVHAHADCLRAVPAHSAHVTLALVGQVRDADVQAIENALQEVAQQRAPFQIVLSGARVLRARQDPRLVMVPVTTGAEPLAAAARDLHCAIAARLPSVDLSPAKGAHVTVARFRKHARASAGRTVEATLTSSPLGSLVLHDEVHEFHLIESTLATSGPEYRARFSIPFAGGAL